MLLKTVSLTLLVFFMSASSTTMEAGYAEIHIFRPKQFQGGAVVFQAQVNNKTIGHLSNGSRMTYRVYNEGAIDLKLKASVFTSKTVSFGVIKGQKYYIKAGYGDGFGSKLSFVQLPSSEGQVQFEDITKYHKKKIKIIEEDPENSGVVNDDVYSLDLEKFEQKEGKKPGMGWISPVRNHFRTDVGIFSLQLCLKSDADKIDVSVRLNGENFEELKDIPTYDKKCSYTYIANLDLAPGENRVEIKLTDEFGESNFSRRIYYKEAEKVSYRGLALVIGNSDYTHATGLDNPKNDAYDMNTALEKLGFEVMKFQNLGAAEMKKVIGNYLLKLEEYKIGVVFYAGHGIQNAGRNYLVPVDVELNQAEDIPATCIDTGGILTKMELMEVETSIIILDACRNNPFKNLQTRQGDSTVGLTGTDAPPGTIVAFATAPGKTASDGFGKNGLYTQEILKHIYKPGLKLEDLFKQVRVSVMKKSNNQQIPWETSSLVKDFYFYQQAN